MGWISGNQKVLHGLLVMARLKALPRSTAKTRTDQGTRCRSTCYLHTGRARHKLLQWWIPGPAKRCPRLRSPTYFSIYVVTDPSAVLALLLRKLTTSRTFPQRQDWWIVVDGIVYDCTDFFLEHPGGAQVIASFIGEELQLAILAISQQDDHGAIWKGVKDR